MSCRRAARGAGRAQPDWRARLRSAVALAETQRAHDAMLDRGVSTAFECARGAVVAAIDAVKAARRERGRDRR